MKSAKELVTQYRARGYNTERLRALADGRPEPMRSEILAILDAEADVMGLASMDGHALAAAREGLALLGQMIEQDNRTPVETAAEYSNESSSEMSADSGNTQDQAEELALTQAESHVPAVDEIPDMPQAGDPASTLFDMESKILDIVDGETEILLIEQDSEIPSRPSSGMYQAVPELEPQAETVPIVRQIIAENKPVAEVKPEEVQGSLDLTTEDKAEENAEEKTNSLPDLIPLYSLSLTSEEYNELFEGLEPTPSEIIDLSEGGKVCGEHWPTAAELPADDEAMEDVFLPHGEEKYREVIAGNTSVSKGEKHLERSLQIIELAGLMNELQTIEETDKSKLGGFDSVEMVMDDEDEPVVTKIETEAVAKETDETDTPVAEEQSNVIAFQTPDYEEETADLHLVSNEESAILQFPDPVTEAYDTIRAAFTYTGMDDDGISESEMNAIMASHEAELAREREISQEARRMYIELEAELTGLRRWVAEVEDAMKLHNVESAELSKALAERNETLKIQATEIETLRARMSTDASAWNEADEWRGRYEEAMRSLHAANDEIAELEREYNILRTEKVPNLMQDKEDLVMLLEEQSGTEIGLRHDLASSRIRSRMGYAAATAACFLAVLLPAVHWANRSAEVDNLHQREESLVAQVQQSRRLLSTKETEVSAMAATWQKRLSDQEQAYRTERAAWQNRNDELAALCKARGDELDRVQTSNTVATAASATVTDQATAQTASLPRNEVRGVTEWLNRNNQRTAVVTEAETTTTAAVSNRMRTTTVLKGEGLSHVLWRECGGSDAALIKLVAKLNNLKLNRRGDPIIYPDQELILPPKNASVASAR